MAIGRLAEARVGYLGANRVRYGIGKTSLEVGRECFPLFLIGEGHAIGIEESWLINSYSLY